MKKFFGWLVIGAFLVGVVVGVVFLFGRQRRLVVKSEVSGYRLEVVNQERLDLFLERLGIWDQILSSVEARELRKPKKISLILTRNVQPYLTYYDFDRGDKIPFQSMGYQFYKNSKAADIYVHFSDEWLDKFMAPGWSRLTRDTLISICYVAGFNKNGVEYNQRCRDLVEVYLDGKEEIFRVVKEKARSWRLVKPVYASYCAGTYSCGVPYYKCTNGQQGGCTTKNLSENCHVVQDMSAGELE
ncbi:MAG: hypothetical protein JXM73_17020 [Anaerolineae bacterium]|nr:hypothetical protein [Anaerolineae bacterium]